MEVFTKALLAKWRWWFLKEQGRLWARVLNSKYGCFDRSYEMRITGREFTWWWDLYSICNGGGGIGSIIMLDVEWGKE